MCHERKFGIHNSIYSWDRMLKFGILCNDIKTMCHEQALHALATRLRPWKRNWQRLRWQHHWPRIRWLYPWSRPWYGIGQLTYVSPLLRHGYVLCYMYVLWYALVSLTYATPCHRIGYAYAMPTLRLDHDYTLRLHYDFTMTMTLGHLFILLQIKKWTSVDIYQQSLS